MKKSILLLTIVLLGIFIVLLLIFSNYTSNDNQKETVNQGNAGLREIKIKELSLVSYVSDDFTTYNIREDDKYNIGDNIKLFFKVSDYAYIKKDEGYFIYFQVNIKVIGPKGNLIYHLSEEPAFEFMKTMKDMKDIPFIDVLETEMIDPPGKYKVYITVKDMITGREDTKSIVFYLR